MMHVIKVDAVWRGSTCFSLFVVALTNAKCYTRNVDSEKSKRRFEKRKEREEESRQATFLYEATGAYTITY